MCNFVIELVCSPDLLEILNSNVDINCWIVKLYIHDHEPTVVLNTAQKVFSESINYNTTLDNTLI